MERCRTKPRLRTRWICKPETFEAEDHEPGEHIEVAVHHPVGESVNLPLVAPSRDFRAMKLQLEAMAAAKRGDPVTAKTAADALERLAGEPGQHPLAQTIITLQAKEAQALAAHAAGDEPRVIAMMTNAVAIPLPRAPLVTAREHRMGRFLFVVRSRF